MAEFARGARIKPKQPAASPQRPLSEEISWPEFMALVGMYTVNDFKIRDKARFLKYAEVGFDAALRAASSAPAEPKT